MLRVCLNEEQEEASLSTCGVALLFLSRFRLHFSLGLFCCVTFIRLELFSLFVIDLFSRHASF